MVAESRIFGTRFRRRTLDWNQDRSYEETCRLMSSCRALIMANSSSHPGLFPICLCRLGWLPYDIANTSYRRCAAGLQRRKVP